MPMRRISRQPSARFTRRSFFVDESGPRTDNIVKVAVGVGGVVVLFAIIRKIVK